MRTTLILAFALATSLPALADDKPKHCDIDALAEQYIGAFNSRDPDALREVLTADYQVTSPYGTFDREGWIALTGGAWYALPDIQWAIEQTVVEGDKVVFQYSFAGTFTNDFLGYTAVGQWVEGSGLEINQIDGDCRIVRTWNYSDAYNFLGQLD